jgi:uncharacterized protein YlzI (FlbEa/FlbD family)
MIQLTLENGGMCLINEKEILSVVPNDENPQTTDVFVAGELCIPVQETVSEILALIQMKFN